MKTTKLKYFILYLLALIPLVLTIIFYNKLPEQIPMHWDIHGNIDRYDNKFPNAYILPLFALIMPLFMELMSKIDPKKKNYANFKNSFYIMQLIIVLVFGSLNILTLLVSLGYDFISVDLFVKIAIALMFVVMGNIMPKLKHNYFIGVRTPWTLASEEVWFKTHRFSGINWFIGGLIMLALSFIPGTIAATLYFITILISSLASVIYSYVIFAKLKRG